MTALHDLVIKAIRRAQAQGGAVDPVADFGALVELDRLARSATEPPAEDRLVFLDLPLIVGEVHLYRLSWGALDWVADCAGAWYADDPRMYDRALAWAHVHARSPRSFRRCAAVREASAEISRWAGNRSASWQAIMAGVDRLMSELTRSKEGSTEKQDTGSGSGPVLESLMDAYKKPVDYYLWEISAEALSLIIKAHRYRAERLNSELAASAGRAPDADSALARNTIAFQRAAKAFVSAVVARGNMP